MDLSFQNKKWTYSNYLKASSLTYTSDFLITSENKNVKIGEFEKYIYIVILQNIMYNQVHKLLYIYIYIYIYVYVVAYHL